MYVGNLSPGSECHECGKAIDRGVVIGDADYCFDCVDEIILGEDE